jgi:hypothetical protein
MSQPSLELGAVVPTLRFDPADHRYFLDPSGEEIPGVTRVLEVCGLVDFSMVPSDVLQAAQQRGTAVHQALHYLDDGELDQDTLDENLHGYVMAYLAFKNQCGFTPHLVEHRVHSLAHRWAGTLDRTGELLRKDGGADPCIVDFKSGLVLPAHRIQLAAYQSGLPDARKYRRITLALREDGTYRVHEYDGKDYGRDLNVFHAAVALWHWKHDHGKHAA